MLLKYVLLKQISCCIKFVNHEVREGGSRTEALEPRNDHKRQNRPNHLSDGNGITHYGLVNDMAADGQQPFRVT